MENMEQAKIDLHILGSVNEENHLMAKGLNNV